MDELKKNQVIQAQIEIHKTDNSFIKTNIITARLLTKTKIVYFYEIIQYQNLVLETTFLNCLRVHQIRIKVTKIIQTI